MIRVPKMLAVAAVAAASVLVIAGLLGAAGASPSTADKTVEPGITIQASLVAGTKSKLATFYGNVECGKSTIDAKTAIVGEEVRAAVQALDFEECNCEVKVLAKGTLELQRVGDSASVKSTGTEVTTLCSTVAGNVHCVYVTEAIDLGKLEGGDPATIKIPSATIPRLATDPRCDRGAKWDAEYEVTSPKPLYINPE